MSTELYKAYQEKMDAQLREVEASAEKMRAHADKATAEAKIEIHRNLELLKAKQEEATARFNALKASGADQFETLKATVEHSWQELKSSADKLMATFGGK